jgi:hypothetical protein
MSATDLSQESIEEIHQAARELRDDLLPRMYPKFSNPDAIKAAIFGAVAGLHNKKGQNPYQALQTQFQQPSGEIYLQLSDVEGWIARHETALADTQNPEGWLRDLKRDLKIDLRDQALGYSLVSEYNALKQEYGDDLVSTLSDVVSRAIATLPERLQELLYTFLLEPTYIGADHAVLRHDDVQRALNVQLDSIAYSTNAQLMTTSGKSLSSIYHKLHGGKPETSRSYTGTKELIEQLNKKLGEMTGEWRSSFKEMTLWDAINQLCFGQKGRGLVRPYYPNFIRDGARATLLPETASDFQNILMTLRESSANEAVAPQWLTDLFPKRLISPGGFSSGIECRRSGLVFGTFMIPIRENDEVVVAEVQIMSPNMWVAKHWEDMIYKAKSEIQQNLTADAGDDEKKAALKALSTLSNLGLAYYLTAINADVTLGWRDFYADAFNTADKKKYALTQGSEGFTAIQTPNGRIEFVPEWFAQLPADGKLESNKPPAFLQALETETLEAIRPLLQQNNDHPLLNKVYEELSNHQPARVG